MGPAQGLSNQAEAQPAPSFHKPCCSVGAGYRVLGGGYSLVPVQHSSAAAILLTAGTLCTEGSKSPANDSLQAKGKVTTGCLIE